LFAKHPPPKTWGGLKPLCAPQQPKASTPSLTLWFDQDLQFFAKKLINSHIEGFSSLFKT
jgi:hypothetical protein